MIKKPYATNILTVLFKFAIYTKQLTILLKMKDNLKFSCSNEKWIIIFEIAAQIKSVNERKKTTEFFSSK